jgi:endonuclease/exonuclease/phosphatase family metal-dependent hydrolase
MPRPRRRRRALVLLLVLAALLLWWCGRSPPLVLGTFNIRVFPDKHTKPDAVAEAIAELDADAFTVQEILDKTAFKDVLERASALTGRRYAAVFHRYCYPSTNERMNLGIVYDAARVDLLKHRSLTPGESCRPNESPAVLALLRPHGGPPLGLISVHFKAGGKADDFAWRRRQWKWLTAALPALETELAAPVVVAGDFNSTGFLDPKHRERAFIDHQLAEHHLQLPTADLACSEYWKPPRTNSRYEVSLLDHILAPDALRFARAEVLGMCAALACAPQTDPPDRFHTVSDHCPVRVELRR